MIMYKKLLLFAFVAGYIGWFTPTFGQAESSQGSQQASTSAESEWRKGIPAAQQARRDALNAVRRSYAEYRLVQASADGVGDYKRAAEKSSTASTVSFCSPSVAVHNPSHEGMLDVMRYQHELGAQVIDLQYAYDEVVAKAVELIREHLRCVKLHGGSESWRVKAVNEVEESLSKINRAHNNGGPTFADTVHAANYLDVAEAKDGEEAAAIEKSLGTRHWYGNTQSDKHSRWMGTAVLVALGGTLGLCVLSEYGSALKEKVLTMLGYECKKKTSKAKKPLVLATAQSHASGAVATKNQDESSEEGDNAETDSIAVQSE